MRELVDKYLEAHEGAWALTTYKSERSRLRACAQDLHLSPEEFVKRRSGMKLYALKTLLIRIVHMEKWVYENSGIGLGSSNGQSSVGRGRTRYADYLQKHKNRFKHAYVKEDIGVGYEDVRGLLASVSGRNSEVSQAAQSLLGSGLRISELYSVSGDVVRGKGGKTRKVFGGNPSKPSCSQSSLRRALGKIGLKPHTLRKLCATRCAERGATPADLCKIFGWSSIATAYQYLQPKDDQRLEELMK